MGYSGTGQVDHAEVRRLTDALKSGAAVMTHDPAAMRAAMSLAVTELRSEVERLSSPRRRED